MAQSRAQRMQLVLRLAQQREQEAGARLADYRMQLTGEQAQLSQLLEYTQQYQTSYGEHRQGVRASELLAYSGFIQRLHQAVTEQRGKLVRMEQALGQLQAAWQQAYRRRESIAELIARLQREESTLLEQRLQKELDELAAQQDLRRQRGE